MMEEVRKYVVKSLRLKDKYFDSIEQQTKKSTIRLGHIFIQDLYIDLNFETKPTIRALVQAIDYRKKFADISLEDALADGYDSLEGLKTDIMEYYPGITKNSPITIIYFKVAS